MRNGTAKILISGEEFRRVVASAARISTTEGTALSIYDKSGNAERDLKLIKKVLSSGHKSVMEHQNFSIAFDDVSVLVEQFMIEHRLAAYTVKSRRYVDFSGAGYIIPENLEGEAKDIYCKHMDVLFALYEKLTGAGVPREDARFVLPYSFRSNFYMTVNGRELVRIIGEMVNGRGAHIAELKYLGLQLKAQLEEVYPGVMDSEKSVKKCALAHPVTEFNTGCGKDAYSELVSLTADAEKVLGRAMEFAGRFEDEDGDYVTERNMMALVQDDRPRELEYIGAQFIAHDVSLACITHFTRHRIQSLMVPDVATALEKGNYVIPQTVRDSGLLAEYEAVFAAEKKLAEKLVTMGLSRSDVGYLTLAGHVIDIMFEMNGRELLHFLKLRTCARAQWEIRAVAREMLGQLREKCDEIFWAYGPSCLVDGRCPEGRLSCGKPETR